VFEGIRRWYWLSGAGLVLVAVAVFLLWPTSEKEPRAREYRDVSACLLTDEEGIASPQVAPVWAGMQDASLKTLGQVRHLEITGAQDVPNGRSFVGTLVLGKCGVIVAAGQLPVQTVTAVAREHPAQRFMIVGGGTSALSNVSVISDSDPDALRAAVARDITPILQKS